MGDEVVQVNLMSSARHQPMIMLSDTNRDQPVSPERHLWVAVLSDAVDCAAMHSTPEHNTQENRETLSDIAKTWFRSENKGPGSFLWICAEVLNESPKLVLTRCLTLVKQRKRERSKGRRIT